MSKEIIEFYATDGAILNGYLNKGENNNKVLIEIHGMTSNCLKNREHIIAGEVEKLGIDTICFNTRGSDIVRYLKFKDGNKVLAGTAYENVEDSYYDILGTIKYAVELGYTSIYLQGHSLGSTKVVYTFSRMQKENNVFLKYIKGILLLSLVDIADMLKSYADIKMIEYANEKEKKNEIFDLMPVGSFIHPISVKTFLQYAKYNESIDFARYSNEDDEFEVLNKIEIPLFMRWGNINELIKREASNQVEYMRRKIKNNRKDIDFIDEANHSYDGKEQVLAEQICDFLKY